MFLLKLVADLLHGVFALVTRGGSTALTVSDPSSTRPRPTGLQAMSRAAGGVAVLPPHVGHPVVPRAHTSAVQGLLNDPTFTQAVAYVPSGGGHLVSVSETTMRETLAGRPSQSAEGEAAAALYDVLDDPDLLEQALDAADAGDEDAQQVAEGLLVAQCVAIKVACEALATECVAGNPDAVEAARTVFLDCEREPYLLESFLKCKLLGDALRMGAASRYSPQGEEQGHDAVYDPKDLVTT